MFCKKSEIKDAIDEVVEGVTEAIAMGRLQPVINSLVPTIFVCQITSRKYQVSMNYQHKDTRLGDEAVMPHPSSYGSKVVAILKDGMWIR